MNQSQKFLPPSWAVVVPILLDALEQGNETARAAARAELMHLAEIADCAIERARASADVAQSDTITI